MWLIEVYILYRAGPAGVLPGEERQGVCEQPARQVGDGQADQLLPGPQRWVPAPPLGGWGWKRDGEKMFDTVRPCLQMLIHYQWSFFLRRLESWSPFPTPCFFIWFPVFRIWFRTLPDRAPGFPAEKPVAYQNSIGRISALCVRYDKRIWNASNLFYLFNLKRGEQLNFSFNQKRKLAALYPLALLFFFVVAQTRVCHI